MTTDEFDKKIDALQAQGWILQCDLGAAAMRNPMHFWTFRAGHGETQQLHTGRGTTLSRALELLTESIAKSGQHALAN